MSVAAARRTIVFSNPILEQANEPEIKTDGMYWRNVETGVLSVWRAEISDWEVVADYAGTTSLINELLQGTIENPDFQSVMVNAGVLGDLASPEKQDLIGNLAKSMNFAPDGLTITSLSGKSSARLGTQQLEFLAGLGADAVAVAVFGLLQTITAPYLQVGQASQSPRIRLGDLVIEYNASSGNSTFRKA